MINTTHTIIDTTPNATPAPLASPYAQGGQLWRDGHTRANNRVLLVLISNHHTVTCQNIVTGKITSVRRDQFDRGERGFAYMGQMSELSTSNIKAIAATLIESYSNRLFKMGGNPLPTILSPNQQ